MAKFGTKFESKRQDWETPYSLFSPLQEEFSIVIDVCASDENKKCQLRYTKEDDGLSQDWEQWTACWMNPPFGEQGKWVKKAWQEFQKGACVVCLLPARTNTLWWHTYIWNKETHSPYENIEVRFVKGRPKFKGAKYGLPQPLVIVIFNGKEITNEQQCA